MMKHFKMVFFITLVSILFLSKLRASEPSENLSLDKKELEKITKWQEAPREDENEENQEEKERELEIVAYVKDKKISYKEVKDFMEHTYLSDSDKIALFKKEAEMNYPRYLTIKRKLLENNFSIGLKKYLYYKILEEESLKKSETNEAPPVVNQKYYFEKIELAEKNILTQQSEYKKGIESARTQFGEYLIKQGYPHKYQESGLNVYSRWYQGMRMRVFRELQENEMSRFEVSKATSYLQGLIKIYESDANLYYQDILNRAKNSFKNKKMGQKEFTKSLEQNPEFQIVLSSYQETSLENLPLASFSDPAKFSFLSHLIQNTFSEDNSQELANNLKLAFSFARKYKNLEELNKLKEEAVELYQKNGDQLYLILSQVYSLSKIYRQEAILDKESFQKKILTPILSQNQKSTEKIINLNDVQEASLHFCYNQILSDCLAGEIKKYQIQREDSTALNESMAFVIWFYKEAIKTQLQTEKAQYLPVYKKYDLELQKKIMNYLLEKKYSAYVVKYRNKLKEQYNGLLRFKKALGQSMYYGPEAMNYLFE